MSTSSGSAWTRGAEVEVGKAGDVLSSLAAGAGGGGSEEKKKKRNVSWSVHYHFIVWARRGIETHTSFDTASQSRDPV